MLAYETGAAVTVVLTKADLAESDAEVASVRDRVRALAARRADRRVGRRSFQRGRYARLCRRTPRPCSLAKAAWGSRA
ncbi:MAG: hypothetical protein ACLR3C_10225 [Eggerthella lenta]